METQEIKIPEQRITIEFTTSEDAEARAAKDSVTKTVTIVFRDWTLQDFVLASTDRVKIHQMQPRLRKGQDIGKEWIATKPGTKGFRVVPVTATAALIKMFGPERAEKLINQHGDADKAMEHVKQLVG